MDTESIEKRKKAVLVALAALTVLYVDFMFILKPLGSKLKSVSSELRRARSSLLEYKKNFAQLKNLQLDFERMKTKNAYIERKIFSDSDLALFLDDISQKARSSGIKIMQIKPQSAAAAEKDIMLSPLAGGTINENTGFNFYPITIKLELIAGYYQLGEFLNRIEDNPLIAVLDLKINPNSAEPARQKVNLTLKAYVKKSFH